MKNEPASLQDWYKSIIEAGSAKTIVQGQVQKQNHLKIASKVKVRNKDSNISITNITDILYK